MRIEWYRKLLAVLAVLVFFSGLATYLFNAEVVEVPPLYWIIGFGVLTLPVVVSGDTFRTAWRSPMALWCYGFLLLSAAWMLFQSLQSEIVWQEFRTRILSSFFVLIFLPIFSKAKAQLVARRAILAVILVSVGLNIYELFLPLTFSPVVTGRSAGLYINPNISAAALVVGMALSVGMLGQRLRLPYALLVGVGVFITFSRAGVAGWLLTVVALILINEINLKRSLAVAAAVTGVAGILLVSQWENLEGQLHEEGVMNQNVIARVSMLRGADKFDMEDDSSAERRFVGALAWRMFSEHPILGNGVGASIDWSYERSSHNQYLNMMVDHGILGGLILPLLVLAATWRAKGTARRAVMAFACVVLFWGLFSHNVLSEYYILMMFSLASAMSLASRVQQAGDESLAPEAHGKQPPPQY